MGKQLTCPIEKQEVIDEVELAAATAYAGTRKQDSLMLALKVLKRVPEQEFNNDS